VTKRASERAGGGRRTEGSRARRAEAVPRHPQRRREPREGVKTRLRRGLGAKQAAGAARVLGMSTTRRAAVLAIVICALALTLAVPLRTYLSQRAEIKVQEQRHEQLQQEVAALQSRKNALSDPAQVEAEARKRLRYVMPGETPYLIQLPEDTPEGQRAAGRQQAGPGDAAWYQQLWTSLGG